MSILNVKTISSLEKVLPAPTCKATEIKSASVLFGEEFSYQVALKLNDPGHFYTIFEIEIESDLDDCITVYSPRCVPVLLGVYDGFDEDYITKDSALIPDVLEPIHRVTRISPAIYNSVYVSVKVNENVKPGKHTVKLIIKSGNDIFGESVFTLDVIPAKLPKLAIPYTNWFHSDCIATQHNCRVFSEKHWSLIDKYMNMASSHGMNMILTPVITPALDTMVGSERPTVQLVDIFCENEKYSFKFDKLLRWLDLCKKNNYEYLEIAHLFSQWGAVHTPKVVVTENGKKIKKFGWHTDALGEDYKNFLTQFIPALKEVLSENWDKDKVYFHISDEPSEAHIEHYGKLYNFVKPLLGDFKQMDAISDYDIYEKKFIDTPVVCTQSIGNFLGKDIDNLWAYYCCGQGNNNLSNRLIAMRSARNRIMGLELYKHDIKGFLQWGYNFYYARLSTHPINPYLINDSEGGFPAGDGFTVYPTKDGVIPSLRLKAFNEGLQDLRAARLLESLIGREKTLSIVEEDFAVGFYEKNPSSKDLIKTREKINKAIKEAIK